MTPGELATLEPDPSVPPPATLDGDVRAEDWLGLVCHSAKESPPERSETGAYRIGDRCDGPLGYLGQGLIAIRLGVHAKGWALDLAAEGGRDARWGWSALDLSSRQLLEVENDLIAGNLHVFARPPRAQFGKSAET